MDGKNRATSVPVSTSCGDQKPAQAMDLPPNSDRSAAVIRIRLVAFCRKTLCCPAVMIDRLDSKRGDRQVGYLAART
jgi:hypothetical protein